GLTVLLLHRDGAHRDLPLFPTRRSSDLRKWPCPYSPIPASLSVCSYYGRTQALLGFSHQLFQSPRIQTADIGNVPGASYCGGRSDRKSTRLNSSHVSISYAVFCLKKKKL